MKTSPTSDEQRVRVIGVGNVLLRDEGVGIHAVRLLQEQGNLPRGTDCIDGGTGGFILLEAVQEAGRLILIDATDDGRPAGTITRLAPRFARDYPAALAAHDIGLRDLLETAELLGRMPETILFTVSIEMPQPLGMELSPSVAACLALLAEQVCEEASHPAPVA